MGLTRQNMFAKPQLKVLTSWDDGTKLDMRMVNLLHKYGLKGIFFITLDNVGQKDYLEWNEIKAIANMERMEIGSHTVSHPMDMKLLYEEDIHVEVQNSKDMLETALDKQINWFCYPRGRYDERVLAKVGEAGYQFGRTTRVGTITNSVDPLQTHTAVHVYSGRKEYNGKTWFQYAVDRLVDCKLRAEKHNDVIFHLWGHSKEVERDSEWEALEHFFKFLRDQVEVI